MVLKGAKMAKKGAKMAKKGIRKVQNYHETVKKGPNFALGGRRKMAKSNAKGPTVYTTVYSKVFDKFLGG